MLDNYGDENIRSRNVQEGKSPHSVDIKCSLRKEAGHTSYTSSVHKLNQEMLLVLQVQNASILSTLLH